MRFIIYTLTPPMQQIEATPLHIAVQNGHKDTVLALLQAGATVDAKTKVRGALPSECMCVCLQTCACACACACVCVCLYIYAYK